MGQSCGSPGGHGAQPGCRIGDAEAVGGGAHPPACRHAGASEHGDPVAGRGAQEARPDDHVGIGKAREEAGQVTGTVLAVAVHLQEGVHRPRERRTVARAQRAGVPRTRRQGQHLGTIRTRARCRAVPRGVVHDNHPCGRQRGPGVRDHVADGVLLVPRGDHDGRMHCPPRYAIGQGSHRQMVARPTRATSRSRVHGTPASMASWASRQLSGQPRVPRTGPVTT